MRTLAHQVGQQPYGEDLVLLNNSRDDSNVTQALNCYQAFPGISLSGHDSGRKELNSNMLTGSLRLTFEKLSVEHAEGLYQALCNWPTYEHLGEGPPQHVSELAARFSRMAAGPPPDRVDERWINYAVRLRADGSLIGRLEATLVGCRAEVAYVFGPKTWGQGFATEAMSAFQCHLHQTEGVAEFWATAIPQNARSIRLLQRLGYTQISNDWPPLLSYGAGDLVFVLHP